MSVFDNINVEKFVQEEIDVQTHRKPIPSTITQKLTVVSPESMEMIHALLKLHIACISEDKDEIKQAVVTSKNVINKYKLFDL